MEKARYGSVLINLKASDENCVSPYAQDGRNCLIFSGIRSIDVVAPFSGGIYIIDEKERRKIF